MLDIKFIRENKDLIKESIERRGSSVDIEKLLKLDDDRRELISSIEEKRSKQNEVNRKISVTAGSSDRQVLVEDMKKLKDKIQEQEETLKNVTKEWQEIMLTVPNIPDMSVPDGKDDSDNQEIKKWGEVSSFDFEPKNHIEIMKQLDMVDFERGVKAAGFRGYFLKNDGYKMAFAIFNYVSDYLLKKGGFVPMITPSLVRKELFLGTGYLPQGEEELYKTQDETYLSGTAEVPTMGYYMDEVVDKNNLPTKFLSFSPCYRREAGSYGKDEKGIFRVHEFYKLEQVILCEADHNKSVEHHEELLKNVEEIMQSLGIPYRVVVNCIGDLGLGQVKKYDVEAWIPSENKYRETHSCSYFHDFQTRRLNIKYRDNDGKLRYTHSLNNTAITLRALIAILENNQRSDGSVEVPEVLRPYMGKDIIS